MSIHSCMHVSCKVAGFVCLPSANFESLTLRVFATLNQSNTKIEELIESVGNDSQPGFQNSALSDALSDTMAAHTSHSCAHHHASKPLEAPRQTRFDGRVLSTPVCICSVLIARFARLWSRPLPIVHRSFRLVDVQCDTKLCSVLLSVGRARPLSLVPAIEWL